jgi:hypothetical protein
VYTPANATIARGGSYNLDLNNDGIVDFVIGENVAKDGTFGTFQSLFIRAPYRNRINCQSEYCGSSPGAAALRSGSQIGPHASRHGWINPTALAVEVLFKRGSVGYSGSWVNVNERYLGLKFQINGETHYGWARLNVKFRPGLPKNRTWEALLTGYAYETVAGKGIIAGQTKGGDGSDERSDATTHDQVEPHFATLGTLALGAGKFALWRRERD